MPSVDECKNDNTRNGNRSACDQTVSDYCKSNPNDLDFCGCSANSFKNIPDPKMGKLNPKCWADSCSTNPRAYRFAFTDETCPNVCVDNSTIQALGSNITDSQFRQSSCAGQNINVEDDKKAQQQLTDIKKYATYGAGTSIALVVCIVCSLLSLSLLILQK
jgi:hypothetical protein